MFPAIIGFVVLAIALNIVVITTMQNSYTDFIAVTSHTTGINLGAEFNKQLAELEPSLYRDLLQLQTENREDVLYGYTTDYIADIAVERRELSGLLEQLMRSKYQRFQSAVDAQQKAGDSMTLYFADATYWRHQALFNHTMGLLLFQGISIAALIMLLSLGYESSAKTDFVVYSTKVGRKMNNHKLIAGTIVGIGVYVLIASITLSIYFTLNPMGGVWNSSVSSGFNFVRDGFIVRPFVTWHSFTVAEYLLASIGISIALVLSFSLMAHAVGLWLKNSYVGFFVVVALNGTLFLLPFYLPTTMLNFAISQTPIWLIMMRDSWFTDGGSNVIVPHFETVGVIGSIVVLAIISFWSTLRFNRRNMV